MLPNDHHNEDEMDDLASATDEELEAIETLSRPFYNDRREVYWEPWDAPVCVCGRNRKAVYSCFDMSCGYDTHTLSDAWFTQNGVRPRLVGPYRRPEGPVGNSQNFVNWTRLCGDVITEKVRRRIAESAQEQIGPFHRPIPPAKRPVDEMLERVMNYTHPAKIELHGVNMTIGESGVSITAQRVTIGGNDE